MCVWVGAAVCCCVSRRFSCLALVLAELEARKDWFGLFRPFGLLRRGDWRGGVSVDVPFHVCFPDSDVINS